MIRFSISTFRNLISLIQNRSIILTCNCIFFGSSLYDEDGYGAVKRVVERGEDVASVKPMATIVVNYPVIFSYIY